MIRSTLLWGDRRNTGGPTVAHCVQFGGGRSGQPLGFNGSGGNREVREGSKDDEVGKTTAVRMIRGKDEG